MKYEIKPCPFCGSTDAEVVSSTFMACKHAVFCRSCKAHGPFVKSERYAVPAWNKRADGVPGVADCDEVASENDQLVMADARCESLDKVPATGGGQPTETVDSPQWYEGGVETIAKIEAVVDGLPAREAYLLGQVIRYCDRAGKKDEADIDLGKANNYAHRLVSGEWRYSG